MSAIQSMRGYVDHPQWTGRPGDYQRRAQQIVILEGGLAFVPWAHVETTCGTPMCLKYECMNLLLPKRLAYPSGVCVYCGDLAGTMDHLMPRAWTGETQRRSVLIIPACGDCNSRISDAWAVSVVDRRQLAQDRLRTKYAKLLGETEATEVELSLFGNSLRSAATARNNKRRHIQLRLEWPDDPHYDRRAFELAGIDNAEALGLM